MPRSKKTNSKIAPAQATTTLNIIFRGLCALVPRKNEDGQLQDVVVLMPDARNPSGLAQNAPYGAKNKRFLPHPCFLFIDEDCFMAKPTGVDHAIVIGRRKKYLWILDNDHIEFSITGGTSISGSLNGLIHMTSMHPHADSSKIGLNVLPTLISSFDRSRLVARTIINKGTLIPQGTSADHRLPDNTVVRRPELKVEVSSVSAVTLNITDFSGKRGSHSFSITLDNLPSIGGTEGHIIISNMSASSIESTSLVGDPDYDFELVYSVRNTAQDATRGFDITQAGLPIRTLTQPPLVCAMAVYNDM
ncbi:MAG: hypothetical protein WAQ98_31540 [Blastocatellia bacterium]